MVDDESGEHENKELLLAVCTYWTNEYSNDLYILLIRQSFDILALYKSDYYYYYYNLPFPVKLSVVGYWILDTYTYYYYIQFNTCLRYVKQLIKYCYYC